MSNPIALLLSLSIALAPQVNLANYQRIQEGMTMQQVKALLGEPIQPCSGQQFGDNEEEVTCGWIIIDEQSFRSKGVMVSFKKGRVVSKYQSGLKTY